MSGRLLALCAGMAAACALAVPAATAQVAAEIVFSTPRGVFGVDADGSGLHRIAARPAVDQHADPAWSPGGDRLAFTFCISDECGIEIFSAATGTRRMLTLRERYPRLSRRVFAHRGGPTWAPGGMALAYRDEWAIGRSLLQVVSLESGNVRPLTRPRDDRWDGAPAWSPDGRTVAFVRRHVRVRPGGNAVQGPPAIYLVGRDGGRARRLTSGDSPSWSPDGRRLVLAWGNGIYRIDADGGSRTRIARVAGTRGSGLEPRFAPDGRSLLFRKREPRGASIWTIDANGRNRRHILSLRGEALELAVSGVGWRPR